MEQISETIFALLSANAVLISLNIDVQPIISDQKSEMPLVNYAISELAGITKDRAFPYSISIKVYSETYKQTLQIVDAVKTSFEAVGIFKYNGTQEPQVDAYGQLYTESNYSLKK